MDRQLVVWRTLPPRDRLRFEVLDGFWSRLRGLLGTDACAPPVALVDCSAIHTFAMGYRIDVAFVAADGYVLASYRSVPPGRLLSQRGARIVLERPHARGRWLAAGESVGMVWDGEAAPAIMRGEVQPDARRRAS